MVTMNDYEKLIPFSIISDLKSSGITRIDTLIRIPIFDGQSLLDKLKNNEDVSSLLPTLKAIGIKETEARQIPKGSGKNLRSFSETINDYSIPLYLND